MEIGSLETDLVEELVQPPVEDSDPAFVNYVHLMRALFAKASIQSTRFGDKMHTNTTEIKRDIRNKTKESAALQQKIGQAAFYGAVFGGACVAVQLFNLIGEQAKSGLKFLGEQGAAAGSQMYSSYQTAQKQLFDAIINMRQTEYSQVSQKDPAANMQQNLQSLNDLSARMFVDIAKN